jgi:hypothetical protein
LVEQVLLLLFPKYRFAFTPSSLLLTLEGKTAIIDENNFDNLQKMLSLIFCLKKSEQSFNPANKKA